MFVHKGKVEIGNSSWYMGLQFQRGLSGADWELEERATKKFGRAESVSLYKGADLIIRAAKMEIPVKDGLL